LLEVRRRLEELVQRLRDLLVIDLVALLGLDDQRGVQKRLDRLHVVGVDGGEQRLAAGADFLFGRGVIRPRNRRQERRETEKKGRERAGGAEQGRVLSRRAAPDRLFRAWRTEDGSSVIDRPH